MQFCGQGTKDSEGTDGKKFISEKSKERGFCPKIFLKITNINKGP